MIGRGDQLRDRRGIGPAEFVALDDVYAIGAKLLGMLSGVIVLPIRTRMRKPCSTAAGADQSCCARERA